jgi:NAD-dependent dihydropyrimidine dehydrogenase PreA subunit
MGESALKRKIIKIDKALCNGCGLCVEACHEGAIRLVDDKAELVNDKYCDGLGDCLPACPTGAIEIIEREAVPYDQKAVDAKQNQKRKKEEVLASCACSGGIPKNIIRENAHPHVCQCQSENGEKENDSQHTHQQAQLRNWPVQLKLINPGADYLDQADILIAADCVAYAYGNLHRDFIKDRITIIDCPKLDDNNYYTEKLTEIFTENKINSITVLRMEVPCCRGIFTAVKTAMLNAKKIVPYKELIIGINGEIKI